MQTLGIIDTKAANLNSVLVMCKRVQNIEVKVSADTNELEHCDKLILPGVGTASAVMQGIVENKLSEFILSTKKDLLGICLGMQVLGSKSAESPLGSKGQYVKTLGVVPYSVEKMVSETLTLPHMGWNTLKHNDHPLFKDLKQDSFFYFVHSYCMEVNEYTIGICNYTKDFSAAICKDNYIGVQFHPEKSGANGALLLNNFLNL